MPDFFLMAWSWRSEQDLGRGLEDKKHRCSGVFYRKRRSFVMFSGWAKAKAENIKKRVTEAELFCVWRKTLRSKKAPSLPLLKICKKSLLAGRL